VVTTYDDLGDDGTFEFLVRLRDYSISTIENRAYELSLEDVTGTRFQLIVWEKATAAKDYQWEPGQWYRLGGVTANEWPSGTVAHGATQLTIEEASGPATEPTTILYLTDSHLGKTTHTYQGKTWAVTPSEGFQAAIDMAIENAVTAVVHGGDCFHNAGEGIGDAETKECRDALTRLAEAGIPFYFIHGNHEEEAGKRVFQRLCDDTLATKLGSRYEVIGNTVALYGIDHQRKFSEYVYDFESSAEGLQNILCMHQSLAPFTASSNPDTRLEEVKANAGIPLELVITGHVHTRKAQLTGAQCGIAGGATANVGATETDLSRSVEMISANEEKITVQRCLV